MTETSAGHAQRIRDWCVAEGLHVDGDARSGPIALACVIDGQRFDVTIDFTEVKAVLRHEVRVPLDAYSLNFPGSEGVDLPTFEDLFNRMITNRWGPLTGSARSEATQWHVTLECCWYLEDLSRTAFMAALAEVVKTRRVLDTMARDMATQRDALRKLDAPSRSAPPRAAVAVGGTPTSGENTAPRTTQPWRPTHTAGAQTWTWPQPDASTPSTTRLDPSLQVMVIETRDGWAHIVCSNNWSAWVGARELKPVQ